MYKKLLLVGYGIFSIFSISTAQVIDPDALGYYTDALRYSQNQPFGTARIQGMGGVNNALGGDLSSIAGNPAGLGVYNKSDMGMSLGFGFGGTSSTYFGNTNKDNRDYLCVPNMGVVFASKRDLDDNSKFKGGAFGIGLTRMSSFQNQFSYFGTNNQNSMTDYFVKLANGTPVSVFDQQDLQELTDLQSLAYQTFLINPIGNGDQYSTFNQGYSSKQQESVLTRGAISQWNLSYGGNFNDKVYIGAGLGLPQLRYISEKSYRENVINNDTLDNFKLNEILKVRGSGINFKMGVIVKPSDVVRLGFSLTSPTYYYSINEQFSASLTAKFKDITYAGYQLVNEQQKTIPGIFKYKLSTPMRIAGGIAIFAGKSGFISADIEYVPYSRARLKESGIYQTLDNSTFVADNKTIQNLYKSTLNINLGGELRKDIYRFRAGFALLGDPYNNIDNVNRKTVNITAGAGIRMDEYYIDVALVNSRNKSIYVPYTLDSGSPQVSIKNSITSFVISGGVFF